MSDVSDGSGPIPRRTSRAAEGGAPVSGALAIGLAIVAVVAGFFTLRSISDDGKNQLDASEPTAGADGSAGVTVPGGTTPDAGTGGVPTLPPTPTPTTLVTTGASVIVSNANGTPGSAGTMSTALQGVGFLTVDPTNSDDTVDVSAVYFAPDQAAAQQVATAVGVALGGLVPQPLPAEVPIQDGDMKGAGVLVMLGTDKVDFVVLPVNPTAAAAVPVATATTLPAG